MTPPLVPADVVIPRLPWVPIYADRLWSSDFFAVATDAEFRAAFCLWLKSWTQRPAGSLPNDDRLLCRLAELNGNLAKWGKVKRIALRHWILCDDDRLYHPVVAELVLDTHKRLSAKQERMANARAARVINKANNNTNNNANDLPSPPHPLSRDKHNLDGARARTREHAPEGKVFSKNGGSGAAAPPPPINPKILNHGEVCSCNNCTRWAAQQQRAG